MSYQWLIRTLRAGQAALLGAALWSGVAAWQQFSTIRAFPEAKANGSSASSSFDSPSSKQSPAAVHETQAPESSDAFERYAPSFSRQIFVRRAPPQKTEPSLNTVETKPFVPPAWKLMGVVSGDAPRAVILTERGTVRTVGIGEQVQSGRVTAIASDRVSVQMDEETFELSL